MNQHIEDFCEDKARAGDGSFAIAFALLQLARHQGQVAKKLDELTGISEALSNLKVNALISGSLDIDNG